MSSAIESITTADTTEALERRFRAEGFRPGIPPHIDERTRAIDSHLCRRMKCPGCHRRRMIYRPFTDGTIYRILAACQHCGAAEEA